MRIYSGGLRRKLIRILLVFAAMFSLAVSFGAIKPSGLVESARRQIGVTVSYDPTYRKLEYPGGDVPRKAGVCTDVIIRALREQGVDLQKEVHEDMSRNFEAYPKNWGLKKPDRNIDHRRVPNLRTYFKRKGYARAVTDEAGNFEAGDIVTWVLEGGLTHIGIVSDRKSSEGVPLMIHNIGSGTKEEDVLFKFRMTGHYRLK